jgi:hypothetical protein
MYTFRDVAFPTHDSSTYTENHMDTNFTAVQLNRMHARNRLFTRSTTRLFLIGKACPYYTTVTFRAAPKGDLQLYRSLFNSYTHSQTKRLQATGFCREEAIHTHKKLGNKRLESNSTLPVRIIPLLKLFATLLIPYSTIYAYLQNNFHKLSFHSIVPPPPFCINISSTRYP